MANSTMLRELLRFHQVPAYLNATAEFITEDSLVIKTPEGKQTIPADSVILSVGYTPDKHLEPAEKPKKQASGAPQLYFIGDCDKVGSLKTVVKQAYETVQKISYA